MKNEIIELSERELAAIHGGDDVTWAAYGGAVASGATAGALYGTFGGGPVGAAGGALLGAGGATIGFGIGLLVNWLSSS